jgi:hypothetical protein
MMKLPLRFSVPPTTSAPARTPLDRHRLSGDHRFVDSAASLDDRTIDRHLAAGPDPKPHPGVDLL